MIAMKSRRWTARDAKKCIVIPSEIDHKYSRGTLGMITGSAKYPGAAVLTSRAALATGLGVLRFHSSSGLAHLVLHASPEALVQPGKVDAWIVGCGIDENKYSDYTTWLRHRWFKLVKSQTVPTVLDAGALNLAGKLSQPTLITPHAGELARLLNKRGISVTSEAIEADPRKWAVKASESMGVVVLLKGSQTVVANVKELIELPKSTPWLATAGSGDVLAGIIGALVATNYIEILNRPDRLAEVAATASYIHNLAAVNASKDSPISSTAILDFIPEVIQKILK
jgi:hydroxyethylthiazole kinase-like uncharacterized protein yjeF